jgi:hypothetical protein
MAHIGTQDIHTWELFAQWVSQRVPVGICALNPTLNYLPLVGYYLTLWRVVAFVRSGRRE